MHTTSVLRPPSACFGAVAAGLIDPGSGTSPDRSGSWTMGD
jgi:hypothetical protein